MNGKKVVVICLIITAGLGTMVSADVWWQRGDAGSTWEDWSFSTNANPAAPEQYYNPYGIPSASVIVEGVVHTDLPGWYADYLGRTGVWHGDFASVALTINNAPIQNPYKEVWVEVGFRGELLPNALYPNYPGEIYGPDLTAWIGQAEVTNVQEIGRVIESAGSGWRKLTIGWKIWPNPDLERIYLAFHNSGADIDYIKVDTICIPEPTTLVLLAAGCLAMLKKGKK